MAVTKRHVGSGNEIARQASFNSLYLRKTGHLLESRFRYQSFTVDTYWSQSGNTWSDKLHDYGDVIVITKLFFTMVLVHTKSKRCFQIPPLVKSVLEKLRFRERLESLSADVFEPRTSTGSRNFSSSTRISPFSPKMSSYKY